MHTQLETLSQRQTYKARQTATQTQPDADIQSQKKAQTARDMHT